MRQLALDYGAHAAELNEAFERGGEGAAALAEAIVDAAEQPNEFDFIYPADAPIDDKIEAVCTRVYGADGVTFMPAAQEKLKTFTEQGYDTLPVCMAKTHLSLSHDPALLNAPTGFTVTVRDIRAYTGSGWLVPLLGDMQTMPGPRREAGCLRRRHRRERARRSGSSERSATARGRNRKESRRGLHGRALRGAARHDRRGDAGPGRRLGRRVRHRDGRVARRHGGAVRARLGRSRRRRGPGRDAPPPRGAARGRGRGRLRERAHGHADAEGARAGGAGHADRRDALASRRRPAPHRPDRRRRGRARVRDRRLRQPEPPRRCDRRLSVRRLGLPGLPPTSSRSTSRRWRATTGSSWPGLSCAARTRLHSGRSATPSERGRRRRPPARGRAARGRRGAGGRARTRWRRARGSRPSSSATTTPPRPTSAAFDGSPRRWAAATPPSCWRRTSRRPTRSPSSAS